MLRLRKLGVPTPVPYHVNSATSCIYMERIVGHSVKTLLREGALSEAGESAEPSSIAPHIVPLPGTPLCRLPATHAAAAPAACRRRPAELSTVLVGIGRLVAKIHDGGVVHGDLTTSNIMVRDADKGLVRAILFGAPGCEAPPLEALDRTSPRPSRR